MESEHPQNKSLQEALKREFLQAHSRGPILTRERDFEHRVGFEFTQKYPSSLSCLRTIFNAPTPAQQRRAQRDVRGRPAALTEIESEAPT